MKRLTMNQVARANLLHNRKAYFSLAVGILLAVYLASTASLCIHGTLRAKEEQMARRVGRADTLLLNSPDITDEQLRTSGLFDQLGHIHVTAEVEDTGVCTGFYDDTAEALMYRTCESGRLPEKAGEIAAERSALDRLGLEDAVLGDRFTWVMQPFDGAAEQRTYTLVGILREQTPYLDPGVPFTFSHGTAELPAILVSPEDTAYAVGNTVVHRIMTNQPLVSRSVIERYQQSTQRAHFGQYVQFITISHVLGCASPYDLWEQEMNAQAQQVVGYLLLGVALLLSTCVSIASAMESMLAQKTEDIGMLRAVGATRRQVKRLLGRDAWLLALTALPVGVALGCLTAWLLSRWMPEEMLFQPSAYLLLPVAGITMLCVLFSSALPLRTASRQLPMGVLRDTVTLRRAKGIHSRRAFRGTRLIAARHLRLHPMQQAGSIAMTALMLLVSMVLGMMLSWMDWSGLGPQRAFTLAGSGKSATTMASDSFAMEEQVNAGLTQHDLDQLRALPGVSRINTGLTAEAILMLPEEMPAYFKTYDETLTFPNGYVATFPVNILASSLDTSYLEMTQEPVQGDQRDWDFRQLVAPYRQMRALQTILGTEQLPVPITLYVYTLDDVDFSEVELEGEIDLQALDAGQEVLVYAPELCVRINPDGSMSQNTDYGAAQREAWDIVIQNDYFYPGQTLSIKQLYGETPDWFTDETDAAQLTRYYSGLKQVSLNPTVGAVLESDVALDGGASPFRLCVITTPRGAQALKLNTNGVTTASITLSIDPDSETEALLERNIQRIALRRSMNVTNHLAAQRETRAYQLQLLALFLGMALLFFAVSVSMQVTSAARRIRADERMIGTLRAVGADERALMACYRLPTLFSVLLGYILVAIAYIVLSLCTRGLMMWRVPFALAGALPLAALNALCAMLGIRRQLRRVMTRSIIENIREVE